MEETKDIADPTAPVRLTKTSDLFGEGNYPQGCKFSPDGLCVLTSTAADSRLRLYNTCWNEQTEWKMALASNGGDTVRSYMWYPHMKSSQSETCCFLAASRDQPVHLYDAYTSRIRASYRPYNALDEMESPTVVSFTPDGQRIFTGGFQSDRTIHVFDVAVPGRESTILRLGKTRRSSDGQKGLLSALSFSPLGGSNHVFCVGTYAPGSIYVYDDRIPSSSGSNTTLNGVCVVGHGRSHSRKKRRFAAITEDGQDQNIFSAAKIQWYQGRARGGITQLKFSPVNDYTLYSASRRSDSVLLWDLRAVSGNPDHASNPIRGISSFATDSDTNQRLEFDLDENGENLFIGGKDKCVRMYNTSTGKLAGTLDGLEDTANGVSYYHHQESNTRLLAVAVGARRFSQGYESDESESSSPDASEYVVPGTVELYKLSKVSPSC